MKITNIQLENLFFLFASHFSPTAAAFSPLFYVESGGQRQFTTIQYQILLSKGISIVITYKSTYTFKITKLLEGNLQRPTIYKKMTRRVKI
jgi:hypothetical protein